MPLSRQKILDAAVELVDLEGLDGLTMRALGRKLGVEAMSLYRHVENKSDLLDGVFEAVASEVELREPTGDWHADTRAAARKFYDALSRHPNVLPLFATRPAVTRSALTSLERALRILAQDGASTAEALAMFNTVFAYLLGFATLQANPRDEILVDYAALDPEQFPMLRNLNPARSQEEVWAAFERGLDAVLVGLRRSTRR